MRRIALPILSLLAVACSKDSVETSFKEPETAVNVDENPDETAKENPPEEPVNTAPLFAEGFFSVDEHSPAGTSIGFLTATDAEDDEITYIMESDIDVELDETTGELKVGTDLNLNFESASSLDFQVSAFDGKTLSEKDFTLNIKDVDEVSLLSEEQTEFIDYFQYLTFWKGPSHNANESNQKWESAMKLNLQGTISEPFQSTVESVISQFNNLFEDGDFNISLTENSEEANAELFFGTKEEVEAVWPDMYEIISGGNYSGYAMTPSQNSVLISTRIWVSDPLEVLLKHELGHALGFGHSNKCDDEHSFLCSQISADNDILAEEASIIRLLYHADVSAGLSEDEIEEVLAHLLIDGE